MLEQKYLILLSIISPPISSLLILDGLLFSSTFCQIPLFLLRLSNTFSTPFIPPCLSSPLPYWLLHSCALLSRPRNTDAFTLDSVAPSASSELIAFSNDSHPVRPIVLVEYALNASAISSADWHSLCHLLIFWVFLTFKPLFFFFLPPKWPFLFHCQTAARGSDWQMFSIWIPSILEGNVAVALPNFFFLHCRSESINVFIYFFISERQSACFVLMSAQQAVGRGCRF